MANIDPFGVDLSTGKNRTVKTGDVLTDDQGNPLLIQGVTGLLGLTGIYGQTGIQGVTGFYGQTGIQGGTGIQGSTGIQGVTGFYGQTGILGNTGIQGVTGLGTGGDTMYIPVSVANDQTMFTLSPTPTNTVSIIMFINGGAYYPPTYFTASGSTVTWLNAFALISTDAVAFRYT